MEKAGSVLETVKTLMRENRPGECWADERRRALLLQFSVEMFQKPEQKKTAGFSDAQRMALQREIDERPAARMSAKDMAKIVGLSADYFTRVFRITYGLAPRAWVLRERLRHAALLLEESTLRVGEIATRLGYDDLYLFSRQFRFEFGCSPRCWRQTDAWKNAGP